MDAYSPHDDLGRMLAREWLETNGLGSYASATVSGAGTRRYHGLLVAALSPPVGRHVLLSRLEDVLLVDGAAFPLSTNVYRGAVFPEGYRAISHFEARPVPTWRLSAGGVELERRIWMPQGRQAVAVCYEVLRAPAGTRLGLALRPLVAFRGFHELSSENDAIDTSVDADSGRVSIRPYEHLPTLHLHHNASRFDAEPLWYRDFEYRVELARGYDGREDLFSHGGLTYDLGAGPAFVYASLRRVDWFSWETLVRLESHDRGDRQRRAARAARVRQAPPGIEGPRPLDRWSDTFATRLGEAAEQFIARRGEDARTIIAGYHWFEDWGRDAFISLPGLVLATGRLELAREVISAFARAIDRGMVPNRFPDETGEPEYGSADAALWFVEAVRRFAATTDDPEYVALELRPKVEDVLSSYTSGTRHGIGVDPSDGLLEAGAGGLALTWMDAIVDGVPVTPRRGKPVELNALWFNALLAGATLADAAGDGEAAGRWRAAAERARESFDARFPTPDGWLFDVVDGPEGDDVSFRPNQLLAVSLHHPVLREELWARVVDEVGRRLLTPMGLRTLDPADPRYRGVYGGSAAERDANYHNGAAWPWLLGPYASAYLRAHGRTPETLAHVRETVQPLSRHLGTEGCLGQISEIADGDAPHAPKGCVAQAWSVAEIARVLIEDLR